MDLKEFYGIVGAPVVVGAVELIKRIFPGLEARFYPIIAFLWAEIINLSIAYVMHFDYATSAIVGFITTLIACGAFQYGKAQEIKSDALHASN
jgi:hypothetical protein